MSRDPFARVEHLMACPERTPDWCDGTETVDFALKRAGAFFEKGFPARAAQEFWIAVGEALTLGGLTKEQRPVLINLWFTYSGGEA